MSRNDRRSDTRPQSARSSANVRYRLRMLRMATLFSCVAIAPLRLAVGDPAAGPAGELGAERSSDLDAQERELRRQREEIDKKLADLEARRHTGSATPLPTTAHAASPSGEGPSVAPAATRPIGPDETAAKADWFNAHGQITVITQEHDHFHAPYTGPLSLPRDEGEKTSLTATLFLGLRLPWQGGEVYLNPEVAGGEGFGNVTGIAGFTNGEIPRVSSPEPEPYVARLFYRQTFGFTGETEKLEDGPNQLPVTESVSRLTVTLGKFSAVDFFQQSAYANDPRGQFENWALFTNGAWDYPADTRGYTEGGIVELNQPNWAIRYGAMTVPKTANGGTFDSRLPQALGNAIELEERYKLHNRPGAAADGVCQRR